VKETTAFIDIYTANAIASVPSITGAAKRALAVGTTCIHVARIHSTIAFIDIWAHNAIAREADVAVA
jgi:hypothetical protein